MRPIRILVAVVMVVGWWGIAWTEKPAHRPLNVSREQVFAKLNKVFPPLERIVRSDGSVQYRSFHDDLSSYIMITERDGRVVNVNYALAPSPSSKITALRMVFAATVITNIEPKAGDPKEVAVLLVRAGEELLDTAERVKTKDGIMVIGNGLKKLRFGAVTVTAGITINMLDLNIFASDLKPSGHNPFKSMSAEDRLKTLCDAAWKADVQTVIEVIDAGVDVNALCDGRTPLMMAVTSSDKKNKDYIATADLLIKAGADPENSASVKAGKEFPMNTALTYAAAAGDPDMVKLLVQHGVDLDAKDAVGLSAALKADIGGHTDIVRFLLDKGAKETPLHKLYRQFRNRARTLKRVKLVRISPVESDGKFVLSVHYTDNHITGDASSPLLLAIYSALAAKEAGLDVSALSITVTTADNKPRAFLRADMTSAPPCLLEWAASQKAPKGQTDAVFDWIRSWETTIVDPTWKVYAGLSK